VLEASRCEAVVVENDCYDGGCCSLIINADGITCTLISASECNQVGRSRLASVTTTWTGLTMVLVGVTELSYEESQTGKKQPVLISSIMMMKQVVTFIRACQCQVFRDRARNHDNLLHQASWRKDDTGFDATTLIKDPFMSLNGAPLLHCSFGRRWYSSRASHCIGIHDRCSV